MAKVFTLLVVLLLSCSELGARTTLVNKGKAQSRIVLRDTTAHSREAASLLQSFIYQTTQATLPIVTEGKKSRGGDIVILPASQPEVEDAYRLYTKDGKIYIQSKGGKGAVYGAVTLLEKYTGVQYFAPHVYSLTPCETLVWPTLDEEDAPAFRFRQMNGWDENPDSVYTQWFRLERPEDYFIDNLWVHTFNRILPSDEFGAAHPEYYALINGERRPGSHSQWCLSNPEVFEVVSQRLDSIFRSNPTMRMISISQNDGNDTYCTCTTCKAIDDEEGAHSGSLIRFLNKLARRFPEKEFSTLAYLYSMQPPGKTKPLPNVNIMLCDIDCRREVPLTDNESGRAFVKALEGWSAISDNLFVWDYGINFDNIVSPFPNLHILQPNIQLFKKHHAQMHFSQINSLHGGDFSELRAYLVGKLLWNPDVDVDSLTQTFLRGYYGEKAAPYLYQYLKIMQGGLLASGIPLWIYDTPVSHKHGMLNANLLKTYNALFDAAEEAVKDEPELLDRIHLSRLSLQYAELEILRTEPNGDKARAREILAQFEERTRRFNVTTLNERHNPPSEYCDMYAKRYLPSSEVSLAQGCKVTHIIEPNERYRELGETALTDGLYGGTSYGESWVGWIGSDAEFVIDLGEKKEFSRVEMDFLHHLGAWILLPKGGKISYSDDQKEYQQLGEFSFEEDRDLKVKYVPGIVESAKPVSGRYIKVEVKGIGLCPEWHYGVGYPACFFADEVTVH